ncbi:hypothetical protein FJR11_07855 [Anabaena sp. UHCC 0187]|nr:hypothetical protein [Anabaena sp. UHCC 0187]
MALALRVSILELLFFAYLSTETIALESIHANRAAFIVSLSHIFVSEPILAVLVTSTDKY